MDIMMENEIKKIEFRDIDPYVLENLILDIATKKNIFEYKSVPRLSTLCSKFITNKTLSCVFTGSNIKLISCSECAKEKFGIDIERVNDINLYNNHKKHIIMSYNNSIFNLINDSLFKGERVICYKNKNYKISKSQVLFLKNNNFELNE